MTLLTGSLAGPESRRVLEALADGRAQVVVGTHALFQERVAFARLGLVVVDEQHRFGVEQRGALEAKTRAGPPHVLLMTATPIPRTIGQVLYADLDVTDLRTAPSGRLPIRTGLRHPDHLDRLWTFVAREAAAGRQTFVVVPHIDEADEAAVDAPDDVAGAEAEATRLRALLNAPERLAAAGLERQLVVGLVHGRLRPADRDAAMAGFRDGARRRARRHDRGRGRRGRPGGERHGDRGRGPLRAGPAPPAPRPRGTGHRPGLVRPGERPASVRRAPGHRAERGEIEPVVRTGAPGRGRAARDGFALAEVDFELRREGDVLGYAQHGLPRLRVATLARADHRELAVAARRHAEALLLADGGVARTGTALARELDRGWLRDVAAGEPATGA